MGKTFPVHIELAPHPDAASVPQVRHRFVDEVIASGLSADLDSLGVCVSEVMTNAILHGSPPLKIAMRLDEQLLRVECSDAGPRPDDTPGSDGAHGFVLVDALAASWSFTRTANATHVWFELPTALTNH